MPIARMGGLCFPPFAFRGFFRDGEKGDIASSVLLLPFHTTGPCDDSLTLLLSPFWILHPCLYPSALNVSEQTSRKPPTIGFDTTAPAIEDTSDESIFRRLTAEARARAKQAKAKGKGDVECE